MSSAVLGIDVGTTGVRAVVFVDGEVRAEAREACPPEISPGGRAEADPETWWVALRNVLGKIRSRTRLDDVEAIGVVGQAPTAVLVDADSKPVRPALLWLDVRATEESRSMSQRLGPGGVEAIGSNRSHAYFLGPKLAWLATHEPEALERTSLILPSHGFIVLRLTGEVACDLSVAMLSTPLFDARAKEWSTTGANAVGIRLSQLPRLMDSHAVVGHVTAAAARGTGLREGTPVVAGGGDFAAAALGSGVIEEGQVGLMLGTAGNLLLPRKAAQFDTRLIQSHHVGADRWLTLGGTLCGAALHWFRETCAGGASWAALEKEAEQLPNAPESLIVLPYFQGERTPIWNEQARAVIFGASLSHKRGHLYRALLEGIALGFKHAARVAQENGIELRQVIATNGAGQSALFRQILCDALGAPLAWANDSFATTRGGAILAALGAGVLRSVAALGPWVETVPTVRHFPDRRSQARLEDLFVRRLSLLQAIEPQFSCGDAGANPSHSLFS